MAHERARVEVLETEALFNEAYNLHNVHSLREMLERFGLVGLVVDSDIQIIACREDRDGNEKIIMFGGKPPSLIGYVRRFYSSYDLILYPLQVYPPLRIRGKSTPASVDIWVMSNNIHVINIINERKKRLRGLRRMVEEIRRARDNVNMEKVEELLGKLGIKVKSISLKSKVRTERDYKYIKYVEITFYEQVYYEPTLHILVSMPRSIRDSPPRVYVTFYKPLEIEVTPLVPVEISYSIYYKPF